MTREERERYQAGFTLLNEIAAKVLPRKRKPRQPISPLRKEFLRRQLDRRNHNERKKA